MRNVQSDVAEVGGEFEPESVQLFEYHPSSVRMTTRTCSRCGAAYRPCTTGQQGSDRRPAADGSRSAPVGIRCAPETPLAQLSWL